MLRLSPKEMVRKIQAFKCFEAVARDGSFSIKVEEYVPFLCTAVHHGHRFRPELASKCVLSQEDRLYEEDPCTGDFIKSLPITLIAHDSRYEYDLNRSPEQAIYDVAWGRLVWKEPLDAKQTQLSLRKHARFYEVLRALVQAIETKHGACLVFDIHSYNFKRHEEGISGDFNVGTERVDRERFGLQIDHWKQQLQQVHISGLEPEVTENQLFYGRGYLLAFCQEHFKNTLVLATELRKFYWDESTGTPFPVVIQETAEVLKLAITSTAQFFVEHFTKKGTVHRFNMLSNEIDNELLKVDKGLYHLTKKFELLGQINPINLEVEKRRFLKQGGRDNPDFAYRPLEINPFTFKRSLYDLPLERIRDVDIFHMYSDIVNAYADKVDMLTTIGEREFRYASLRYFGEPKVEDLRTAHFIMELVEFTHGVERNISAEEAVQRFLGARERFGMQFKVEMSNGLVSRALVLNHRRTLKVKRGTFFTENEINALITHEIGVHMVTTLNAIAQPLNFLKLGLPVNTRTQEGMAILAEYFAGTLTITRLKELALRVLVVSHMLEGNDFKQCFQWLVEKYGLSLDQAFYLTTRIYRAGGFTKDYLYLQGFRQILDFEAKDHSLAPLLIGKTSLEYYEVLQELIFREWLNPPTYQNPAFNVPKVKDPKLKYVISCIKPCDPDHKVAS